MWWVGALVLAVAWCVKANAVATGDPTDAILVGHLVKNCSTCHFRVDVLLTTDNGYSENDLATLTKLSPYEIASDTMYVTGQLQLKHIASRLESTPDRYPPTPLQTYTHAKGYANIVLVRINGQTSVYTNIEQPDELIDQWVDEVSSVSTESKVRAPSKLLAPWGPATQY